jgi:hypothetical protein
MQNLKNFIQDNNRWILLISRTAMTFPLSQADVDSLARSLDSKLSPENLYCDGEISRAEANRKHKYLTRVAQELEAYCASNTLTMPTVYEL